MPGPYKVGILTVSDTSHQGTSADRTGPLLSDLFTSSDNASSFNVVSRSIVPDDIPQIQSTLREWSTSGIQLCITTGGTGFAIRDVTPEAVRGLIVKEATGLQHLMLKVSLEKTPMAALARPVAGVTKEGMVIITVPGSPKGAVENVEAVLKLLPHALDLASGGTGKEVHKKMGMPERSSTGQDHGHPHSQHHHADYAHQHSHGHGHGHSTPTPRTVRSMDTSKGASGRHRVSQYPIISLEEAYSQIFDNTRVLATVTQMVDADLTGSITAEDVFSEHDLPTTKTTNVDGYAVSASSTPAGTYPILTSSTYSQIAGGSILEASLPEGYIYRINTGAPLPKCTDAVIMVEDTELASSTEEGEEKEVKLLAQVEAGENIRMPGSDVKKGDKVLEKGSRITEVGGEIGTLAFVGKREISVYRRPVVAIMSTGNEITGLHATPSGSSSNFPIIYDSNRPSLHSVIQSHGFDVIDLGIVPDDENATVNALRLGCTQADVIVTTGGTSMGESDLLKPVIERRLNGTIHFGRVAMKPGKPTTFATIPPSNDHGPSTSTSKDPTIVFALPGNPASALVTFHLFVLPCLRKLSGFPSTHWHLPKVIVQTTSSMRLDSRPEFHRVLIEPIQEPPYLIARSTGGQRSSRTVSLAGANGLVCLPSSEGKQQKEVQKGEMVDAILIGKLG